MKIWHTRPLAGDYGEPKLAVEPPANPRFAHLAWPRMVRTQEGTIIASYIAARFHGSGGEGSPAISVSKDHGKTLTPPQIVDEFRADGTYTHSGNTALGIAGDGAVINLAMGFRGDEAHTILGWRSEDEGKTWAPVDTSNLADDRSGSVYGNILSLPDDRLMVFGHFRAPRSEKGIWVATSDDNGRSWSSPRQVADAGLVEPAATFTEGRIVALYRQSNKPLHSRTWQAVSDDLGRTWDIKQDAIVSSEPGKYRLPSPFVTSDPAQPSLLYSLVTERHVPGNTPGTISLWMAQVNEPEWKKIGLVTTLPSDEENLNRDFGYPWMVPLGKNKWFLLFYFGERAGPCALWSLELKIDHGR
jgi:hypothetical protein